MQKLTSVVLAANSSFLRHESRVLACNADWEGSESLSSDFEEWDLLWAMEQACLLAVGLVVKHKHLPDGPLRTSPGQRSHRTLQILGEKMTTLVKTTALK